MALHDEDLEASRALDAAWSDAASPLHAELAATGRWIAIRLVRGTTAADQFTALFPCDAFPAVMAINPANGGRLHEARGAEAAGDAAGLAAALKGCREALEKQNVQTAAMAALAAAAAASSASAQPAPGAAPPPPPPRPPPGLDPDQTC